MVLKIHAIDLTWNVCTLYCATVMHEFIGGSGMDGIPSET